MQGSDLKLGPVSCQWPHSHGASAGVVWDLHPHPPHMSAWRYSWASLPPAPNSQHDSTSQPMTGSVHSPILYSASIHIVREATVPRSHAFHVQTSHMVVGHMIPDQSHLPHCFTVHYSYTYNYTTCSMSLIAHWKVQCPPNQALRATSLLI